MIKLIDLDNDTLQDLNSVTGIPLNVKHFGVVGNGVTDDTTTLQAAIDAAALNSKTLLIDGLDVTLHSLVSSAADGLTFIFRNGAKISQPVPTERVEQANILNLSGDNLTFYNLHIDGKYDNAGLNEVPSPVGKMVVLSGDHINFYRKTICENSNGITLDILGDDIYMEDILLKNNAYSGLRWFLQKNSKSFVADRITASQDIGARGRKSAFTVNGQFTAGIIKIGVFDGLNSFPFFEADAVAVGERYYKNVYIELLQITHTVDMEYPDGSVATSIAGKMENCENITIDKIYLANNSPLNKGQGFWFGQALNLNVGLIFTNAGDWQFGVNNSINDFSYTHTGNVGNCMIYLTQSEPATISINKLSTNIPAGTPQTHNGIFHILSNNDRFILNRYVVFGDAMGMIRSDRSIIPNLLQLGSELLTSLGFAAELTRQTIGQLTKSYRLEKSSRLTRDVLINEVFYFYNNPHIPIWICTKSGTVTWVDGQLGGTAEFNKILAKINYTGTTLTNLQKELTTSDIGITAVVNGVFSYWDGTQFLAV